MGEPRIIETTETSPGERSTGRFARTRPRAGTAHHAPAGAAVVDGSAIALQALANAAGAAKSERRDRLAVLRRRLFAADVVAGAVAGLAGAAASGAGAESLAFTLATVALWLVIAFTVGLYVVDDLGQWASGIPDVRRIAVGALLAAWPLYGVAAALGAPSPAAAALVAGSGTALLSGALRSAVRGLLHSVVSLRQRTLILGSGVVAEDLAARMRDHSEYGLTPIGIVDDEVHNGGVSGLPVLGGLEDLEAVVEAYSVDRVIIAFSRARHDPLLRSIRICRDRGLAVDVVPRLFELLQGSRAMRYVGGLPLLSIGVPRMSPVSRAAKRTLDLVGSLLFLVALAPVFVVVIVAIKLESRGPAFFTQPRVGRDGRVFKLLKFRSMRTGAPMRVQESGALKKEPTDSRVTRVGRVLRRLSLDEAPQFVNVLLGHMSLVGPRPLVIPEAETVRGTWLERRRALRPGLTGLWQVSGRSSIPFDEMVSLDYQYVAGWSLARDLEILLATVPAVLSGRGAY